MSKESKQLIKDAREQRGVSKMNNNYLIVLINKLKNEIFDIKVQKSKYYHHVIYPAIKGNEEYMHQQAVVLKK